MQRLHFIAIGGMAMHNLAIALSKNSENEVTGSDIYICEPALSLLNENNILPRKRGWFPEKIHRNLDAVIYGANVNANNEELLSAKELGLKTYTFSEYIFHLMRSKTRIVIGGSIEKSATATMILHVLRKVKFKADYVMSTPMPGVDEIISLSDDARVAVLEGDEYVSASHGHKPGFYDYRAHIGIITGKSADHIELFPDYETYLDVFTQFVESMETQARLIYCDCDEEVEKLIEASNRIDLVTFPYTIPKYEEENGVIYAITRKGRVKLPINSVSKLRNLEAARIACRQIGVWDDKFYAALKDFVGVNYRSAKIAERDNSLIFHDFSHSPYKLRAGIAALKRSYPDYKMMVCVELSKYSSMSDSFLEQFENSLQLADRAFVCYNRERLVEMGVKPISKETIQKAFNHPDLIVLTEIGQLKEQLKQQNLEETVLLLMTSGDCSDFDTKELAKDLLK